MNINGNYHLDGHDLTALFDKKFPATSFADPVREHIPNSGSINYSEWIKMADSSIAVLQERKKLSKKKSITPDEDTHVRSAQRRPV